MSRIALITAIGVILTSYSLPGSGHGNGSNGTQTPVVQTPEMQQSYRRIASNPALDALARDASKRLMDSLTFSPEGKVTGFYYRDIQVQLAPAQAQKILRLLDVAEPARLIKTLYPESIAQGNASSLGSNDPFGDPFDDSEGPIDVDYKDYKCVSRATCAAEYFHICTSNC